jgi:hypothetical protein
MRFKGNFFFKGLDCVAKIDSEITRKALFAIDTFPVTISFKGENERVS